MYLDPYRTDFSKILFAVLNSIFPGRQIISLSVFSFAPHSHQMSDLPQWTELEYCVVRAICNRK